MRHRVSVMSLKIQRDLHRQQIGELERTVYELKYREGNVRATVENFAFNSMNYVAESKGFRVHVCVSQDYGISTEVLARLTDEATRAITERATHAKGTCAARQHSDQMCCEECDLVWDMNDPHPPHCKKGNDNG